jgi:hypothetical protein
VKTVTVDDTVDLIDETDRERPTSAGALAAAVVIEGDESGEAKQATLPERALRNDDGSITLPLLKPVTLTIRSSSGAVREEEVRELTFHELNGADLRIIAQASEQMQSIVTFARGTRMATNRMTPLFERMVARDIKAGTAVLSFLSE